jgi:hypothetical protein
MPVVSEVKLIIPTFATPTRVKDQWAEVLGVDASRINEKAQLVISGEGSFSDRLSGPSSAGFNPMISSSFVSKSGKTADQIKTNQRVNLARSYAKWAGKMDFQFATVDGIPCARFKDVVNDSKDSMGAGLALRTLPLTGIKVEGRGLIALAGLWLTGDARVEGMLRAGDEVVIGGSYLICKAEKSFPVRTVLASMLTYVGSEIIKSDWNAALMAVLNQLTCGCLQPFVNPAGDFIPFTVGGDSRCDYEIDGVLGKILHVKISKMS